MAGRGRAAGPPDLARAARVRRRETTPQAAAVQHRDQPGQAERPGPLRQRAATARELAAAAPAGQQQDAASLRAQTRAPPSLTDWHSLRSGTIPGSTARA